MEFASIDPESVVSDSLRESLKILQKSWRIYKEFLQESSRILQEQSARAELSDQKSQKAHLTFRL